MDFTAAGVNS